MALYSVVFLGSTPIGGPLAGWLAQSYDPRVALLLAAASGLAAAWIARISFKRFDIRTAEHALP
jgi:esterase/lipase